MSGTFPDGWRACRHTTGGYDYYAFDIRVADGLTGHLDESLPVATVYADPLHREIEVSVFNGPLTPDEARALAVRLVEAAEAVNAATRGAVSR